MTPIEVDTKLAEVHGRYWALLNRRAGYLNQAETSRSSGSYFKSLAADLEPQINEVLAEMAPLEARYTGWTRAFVVPEGHVHSSMNCSTCRATTEFGWVTSMSGKTEAEIIEAAGSRACTVCYPNAPVDAPAGRIFHATEIAADQARQERTDGFDWGWSHPSFSSEDRDAISGLLAAKLGTTPEEQLQAAQKRAKNRMG